MNDIVIKRGNDLSQEEKNRIINSMIHSGENKKQIKEQLSLKFGITYGTINALMAHHTMQKNKKNGLEKEIIMESEMNKEKVFSILSISGISEKLREEIYDEFIRICNENHLDKNYDFFLDIEAIGYYHDIDPTIVEQYLRNRLPRLGSRLDSLKAGNITLSQENKSFIRKYVEQGINTSNKKTRRKEMATKFNVSIYVIGAITSWKNNGEKLVLTQNIEDNTINQHIEEIVNSEVNEDSNYDVDFILELSREYNIKSSEERAKFLEDIYDCYPEISIEDIKNIIHDFPDDLNNSNLKRNGEGSGVLLNYNNTIKNKWREKLKQFIDENTDKNDRKNLKVLCLPGIECLEIPLYLELGFSPENIIGIESAEINTKNLTPEMEEYLNGYSLKYGISFDKRDNKSVKEILKRIFLENAGKYGIQTRIGKIQEVLKKEETHFDIISLDFLGPISRLLHKITENIKISDRAIICTNFLNKREQKNGKEMLQYAKGTEIHQDMDIYDLLKKMIDTGFFSDKQIDKRTDFANVIKKCFTIESGNIHPLIQDLINQYFSKINIDLTNNNGINYQTINNFKILLVELFYNSFKQYRPITQNIEENEWIDSQINGCLSKILALYQSLIYSDYHIDQSANSSKSYKYIGGFNSGMLSDFFVIKKLTNKELGKYQTIFKFFLKIIEFRLNKKEFTLKINRKNKGNEFSLDNEVILVNDLGIEIYKLKFRHFENSRFSWKKDFGENDLGINPERIEIM